MLDRVNAPFGARDLIFHGGTFSFFSFLSSRYLSRFCFFFVFSWGWKGGDKA